MLQYEADGSFLVRERDSASPLPRGEGGGAPGAVCELVYVFQGRPHTKDVEVTRRGVRFRGGHSYFEDLGVLVLSYTASPGDELRCVLTHAPGQSPQAATLAARAADGAAGLDQSDALESFAFDARTKNKRNRKVSANGGRDGSDGVSLPLSCRLLTLPCPFPQPGGPSKNLAEFARAVEDDVAEADWFKHTPMDVKVCSFFRLFYASLVGPFLFRARKVKALPFCQALLSHTSLSPLPLFPRPPRWICWTVLTALSTSAMERVWGSMS